MKKTFAAVLISITTILACTKETGTVNNTPAPQANAVNNYGIFGSTAARYAGIDYSQSIPVDTANSMILSYLNSIRYPAADTALRSLSIDADTLRAYLQNHNIVTVKFMFAHRAEYKNSGHNGQYSGMNPAAMTMIVVGLNENSEYVLNNRNGVYEHLSPCPIQCPGSSSALIK